MTRITHALFDGKFFQPDDATGLKPNMRVRLTIETEESAEDSAASVKSLRPSGLCEGEFTVPDDFNDPLPDNLLDEFEGQ